MRKRILFIIFLIAFIAFFLTVGKMPAINTYQRTTEYFHNKSVEKSLGEVPTVEKVQKVLEEEKEINVDAKFYLRVEGTNINYPVMHTDNNTFYLDHNKYKNYNINGSIFLDKDNESIDDKHLVIYGHRMSFGTMFNRLTDVLKNKNNKIIIYTSEGEEVYNLIGGFYVNEYDNYRKVDFEDEEDFELWKKSRNLPDYDKIITLSTCTVDDNSKRFIVVGGKNNFKEED